MPKSKRDKGRHDFNLGDMVTVLNRAFSGTIIVEGMATITAILHGENNYRVRFQDGEERGRTWERYVDPQAQEDPQSYVRTLNAQMGIIA